MTLASTEPEEEGVLCVEDWAEIRRLRRSEEMSISEIARVQGVSRNTVKAALRTDGPPKYERKPAGSIVDEVEPRIRELLKAYPTMPATVIAERVGWTRSIRVLSARVAELRPAYLPPDPAGRTSYVAGEIAQCDLWFPPTTVPVGFGQTRHPMHLPVLTMVTGYSRWLSAVLIPSRRCRICSPACGSSSRRWGRCRGCWSGTARERSAGGVLDGPSSRRNVRHSAAPSGPGWWSASRPTRKPRASSNGRTTTS